MYKHFPQKYPNKDQLVIVKIDSHDEFGINVFLLEYGNILAKILFAEVSRARISNMKTKFRIGDKLCCQVVDVDIEKGFIDLTRKNILEDEKKMAEEKYKKNKKIINIVNSFLNKNDIKYEEFMNKTIWCLNRDNYYDSIKDAFAENNLNIFNDFKLEGELQKEFISYLKNKLKSTPQMVRSIFSLKYYGAGGIETIKTIIIDAKRINDTKKQININALKLPEFVIHGLTSNCNEVIEIIEKILNSINETSKSLKGCEFNLIKAPYVLDN